MKWLRGLGQMRLLLVLELTIFGISIGAGSANVLAAGEPPREPILRVETVMHMGRINHIGVDAAGQLLLTTSNDKTARLWSLQDARLLKVLRPPVGAGMDGMLYTGALSPDGRLAAVAGWTGAEWDGSVSIYLFDTASGRLQRRLHGASDVVLRLAFSPDGRFLAAGYAGSNGIRVWRTADWHLTGEDRDYGDSCKGLSFDAAGRLVSASHDGYLRLYDAAMRRQAKVKAPGGSQPHSLAFSPGGQHIAVGYDDTTRLDVLSVQDLKPRFATDTTNIKGGLISVTWSVDGRTLYAAGKDRQQNRHYIRAWSDGGRGASRAISAADDTISDLKALPRGELVFGASEPSWGVLQSDDRLRLGRTAEIADFVRGYENSFRLAPDGTRIAFGYEYMGRRPALFSLPDRHLTLGGGSAFILAEPSTAEPGLVVSDWKNSLSPRLNGKELKLEQHERSRAAAVQGDRLLLGSEWKLRLFDKTGTALWEKPAPEVAWAVNLSGDGRFAVAAYGDGTIRWHRASDGQELLALFPHKDGQRWIAWSPQGYYDASAGADDRIGWHINNGPDKEAAFFPASRFRDHFYRPDVIARVFDTLDVGEALRQADAANNRLTRTASVEGSLPPAVEILDPPTGTTQVTDPRLTLTFVVKSPTAPHRHTKVLVDGRPIEPLKPPTAFQKIGAETYLNITIRVPPRDVDVALVAEDGRGSSSEPAKIRVAWGGPASRPKPDLYVLAVGVTRYKDPIPGLNNLNFPAKDAHDMADALKAQQGRFYGTVTVQSLPDEKASREAVMEGLLWLKRQTTQQDVAAVFLAGHGVRDEEGHYLFLPHDADVNKLELTTVRDTDLQRMLGGIPGKVLLFVDTCYSGAFSPGIRAGDTQPDIDRLVNELASAETGVVVFASSTGRQVSIEDKRWNNGAFTKALVEGLRGKADYNRERAVRVNGLAGYLANRVKELTEGRQMPVMVAPKTIVEDFPIAVVP